MHSTKYLYRLLFIVSCATFVSSVPAVASPVFGINTGTLTLNELLSGGSSTFDVRGAALFSVSDASSGIPLSPLFVTDITGGTDPTAKVLPFGNSLLITADANTTTSGIIDVAYFDFAGALSLSPALVEVPALFVSMPAGSSPDALLADLVHSSPIPVFFGFSTSVDLGGGNQLDQFQLQQVGSLTSTPEPGTWLLALLGGCSLLSVFRSRQRRANQ